MYNSTTDVYKTKREIINFAKGLVPKRNVVESKFVSDLIYRIFKSKSIILKDIGTALNEHIQIKNTIDRLGQNLQRQLSPNIHKNYTKSMTKVLDNNPVILVDDIDVIKPHGIKFEALGLAKGIVLTLAHEKRGIKGWFRIRHNHPCQLKLKWIS